MLTAATTAISAQPTADTRTFTVTVLIAVFAVLLSGLVALAREMRAETAYRP